MRPRSKGWGERRLQGRLLSWAQGLLRRGPSRRQPRVQAHTPLDAALKSQPGKDVWLMGGGGLFRHLLDLGEVDAVNVTIIPVLPGSGTPLLPQPYHPASLTLTTLAGLHE